MKKRKIPILLVLVMIAIFYSCQKPVYQDAEVNLSATSTEDAKLASPQDHSVKFNPGHYWMIYKNQRSNQAYLRPIYREFDNTPALKGIMVKFTWRDLEGEQGVYDFSVMDRLLSEVTQHHAQLIILLELKSFHTTNKQYLVPDYILDNSIYQGGVQPYTAFGSSDQKGDVIKIWNQHVFKRFESLLKRLGHRYNSNPNFEGIGFSESTFQCYPAGSNCVDEGYFFEKLMDLNRALKVHFPNSLTYQYVNYPRKYLEYQANQLKDMAAGWGGPDVFPTDEGLVGGQKAYYWYGQLSGIIPLLPSVQTADYLWTSANRKDPDGHQPTITELYEFARDELKANYIVWERVFYGGHSYFGDVLNKLNESEIKDSPSGGLNADCPSVYQDCNTK